MTAGQVRVRFRAGLGLVMSALLMGDAEAQVRGVYPTGMNATGAGVTPASGFTYSNLFLFNARDELLGPAGETIDTGLNAVMIDLNTIVWVSRSQILGGARLSATATFLVSSNSLASDTSGQLSAGGGFADFYFQPLILGWDLSRVAIRTAYGALAPTGRFTAGATNNVGSGYWTHAPSAGVTIFLTRTRKTALSAFHMYEVHTTQEGTQIKPGDTANLDYSLTQTFTLPAGRQLQVGLAGYGQWQTTARTGPTVTPEERAERYRVNALGFAASVSLPAQKVNLGVKFFKEFSTRSSVQGATLHISGAVTF